MSDYDDDMASAIAAYERDEREAFERALERGEMDADENEWWVNRPHQVTP